MDFNENENSSVADNQEGLTADSNVEAKDNFDTDLNTQSDLDLKDRNINYSEQKKGSKNQDEEALYDEILDKLDIKKKNKSKGNQETIKSEKLKEVLNQLKTAKDLQFKKQMKASVNKDFDKIQKLLKSGLIDSAQGQNLKKQVLKKAFDKIAQAEKVKKGFSDKLNGKITKNMDKSNAFAQFSKNNPEFFNSDGRQKVLEYLKSGGNPIGKEELNKISDIVRIVEKSAIDRYLQKTAHEKTLISSNENAKQRLTANAQKSSRSEALSKTFTREQIGKMSGVEFEKYEPYIMEQLKKGLIK